MERIVKFRGKLKNLGSWVFGELSILGDKTRILSYSRISPQEVVASSVGQLVSICPRTNKEIYEGDIVHYDHEDGIVRAKIVDKAATDENDGLWISGFAHEVIAIDPYPDSNDEAVEYEVIGNIHENPELLTLSEEDSKVFDSTVKFNLSMDFGSFLKMVKCLKENEPQIFEGFRKELSEMLENGVEKYIAK